MKKKFLIAFVSMLFAAALFSGISAHAAEYVASGACGDQWTGQNVGWTLYSDGTLDIKGKGEMMVLFEFFEHPSWYSYRASIKSVVIGEGVTDIGWAVFSDCMNLTSVTLPDTLKSISNFAFWKCSSLESITIPNGVTGIGDYAFSSCSSLESITLSENLTGIAANTFSGCTALKSVTIPAKVRVLGGSAFYGCKSLTSVNIPLSMTSIEGNAFSNCDNFNAIYYAGTKSQWNSIDFTTGNVNLKNIKVIYNYTPPLPVLSTDIRSYVFGSEIESYNVNGSTCIAAEDLMNYGFTVVWDGVARTLSITHPSDDFTQTEKKNFGAKSGNIGEKLTETVPTDIVTYVNGEEVQSYNIGGRTVIYIDALGVFGGVTWDGGARTISVG